MTRHAYSGLPGYCFWRESVATPAPHEVDPVVSAKFKISRSDRVATAGSCFAQHIARKLAEAGFGYFVTEAAHPAFEAHVFKDFNYGVYTARYGNIYTARQLRQLLARAYGDFDPQEDVWSGEGGRVIDPFRPAIQPGGFSCVAELKGDRMQHFAAVRRAIEEMDVFVFTLGLTEAWASARDGAVFPLCPGVSGGEFDRERHVFRNFGVAEVVADLEWIIEFIAARNPRARLFLTVSPVPLAATAEDRSVLVSTTYSKSVLRVAAEEIARAHAHVAYFPSYEIITGAHARYAYFAPDLRSVTEAGVQHVMRLFMKHYASETAAPAAKAEAPERNSTQQVVDRMEMAARVVCEEELLGQR
jgi:hypothetical protein